MGRALQEHCRAPGAMAVPDPLMLKAVDLALEEAPQDIPAVRQDFQKPTGKPVI